MVVMIDKKAIPTKILWVDLEMTGLDPQSDLVLEIAAEITDFDFKTIASYEAIVKQDPAMVVERMQKNIWWADYPQNRDEFVRKVENGKLAQDIEAELIALIETHFGKEPAVLAGNSIYNDRNFIKIVWPKLDLKLHYRMLDVSAWKIVMQAKYDVQFDKKEVHRAFDDIQASIAELQRYLEYFKDGS
ncbi:MAG: oligoribonuclease [Candidatus Saccharimonadales bacterium]